MYNYFRVKIGVSIMDTENNIENNVDNAQLIVSIKTGTFIMYSVIAVLVLALVLICMFYIIRKKNI